MIEQETNGTLGILSIRSWRTTIRSGKVTFLYVAWEEYMQIASEVAGVAY